MQTSLRCSMPASAAEVFDLAAHVEEWPRLLAHYRQVRVLTAGPPRLVQMAATRPVVGRLGIPVWWRAVQRCDPVARRITFEHVAGATRGMTVEWRIEATSDDSAEVTLSHWFSPRWPVPDRLIGLIVGEYFVNGIARRTLRGLEISLTAGRRVPH